MIGLRAIKTQWNRKINRVGKINPVNLASNVTFKLHAKTDSRLILGRRGRPNLLRNANIVLFSQLGGRFLRSLGV